MSNSRLHSVANIFIVASCGMLLVFAISDFLDLRPVIMKSQTSIKSVSEDMDFLQRRIDEVERENEEAAKMRQQSTEMMQRIADSMLTHEERAALLKVLREKKD